MADVVIMRVAEIQFSFPPILIALLLNGVLKTALSPGQFQVSAVPILIGAIGLSGWVQYARVVRASTLVERHKEYVLACEATGFGEFYILRRHVLPNVLGPVLVISMLQLAVAIVTEATLSFLGLGTPVTQPSLGALIQSGSEFLFSGIWWVVIFPGGLLLILVLAFNVVADWLRDFLNPRLR
jgi:peptide/nickel transport system permease protein